MDVQQPDQHARPEPAEPAEPVELAVTERTRHRRLREQGSTRVEDLDAILKAGFVCHLGVVVDGTPMVVPTVYGVDFATRTLFVHGSVASRSIVAAPRATVCVTVTHIDGLVLARSVFEHGVNYRSAMVYAVPRLITEGDELLHGLRVLTEHCAPGQWDYARRPNSKELAATSLLALSLEEASWAADDTGFQRDWYSDELMTVGGAPLWLVTVGGALVVLLAGSLGTVLAVRGRRRRRGDAQLPEPVSHSRPA
ncbi:pyridoxamine 5'-phosphate oxidase family protein [Streptomyces hundungensis]|uniref:pyridoxamine 5'-phosphate oxidase family protein n=1 Tax=Streptomyces hundungensis TaxID=1077946 RepID=UPI0033DCEA06